MSEGIIIALITAVGSLLGGIIGQFISASATVTAAKIKGNVNSANSLKDDKPFSWGNILGGALVGAIATLGILFLLGLFPIVNNNNIDSISGTWLGTAKSGDFEFDVRFEIGKSCKIGSVCGTFDFPSISCSGTLTITKVEGNTFEFQANDRTSGCIVSPEIKDSLQLLPDGTLLYVSKGNSYEETRGVLRKEK
jgi:hypothetical protein